MGSNHISRVEEMKEQERGLGGRRHLLSTHPSIHRPMPPSTHSLADWLRIKAREAGPAGSLKTEKQKPKTKKEERLVTTSTRLSLSLSSAFEITA